VAGKVAPRFGVHWWGTSIQ